MAKSVSTSNRSIGPAAEATFVLHAKQQAFVSSKALYRGFLAGISSGKTVIGAYDLLMRSKPGCLYSIVAPTYRVLQDATLRAFQEVATRLGFWDENQVFKTESRCVLNNGAEILFRSGDSPGHLRGPSLSGTWLDECSQMPEEVFNVMIGRLRQGGVSGFLTGTYTPCGPEHWTARVFNDKTNPLVELIHCSTRDNPFNPPDFYENLKTQYGKGPGGLLRAQQELEGLVVSIDGAEWGPEHFGPEVWFDDFPKRPDEHRVVMLDSSKGVGGKTGDYSSFCMMKWIDNRLWVDFDVSNTRNTEELADTAIEIQRTFQPQAFGIEAEFGVHFFGQNIDDKARRMGVILPLVAVPTQMIKKEVRILRLAPFITNGRVRFRNNDDTRIAVGQFQTFPHGLHDDCPDSAEGALRIMLEGGVEMDCPCPP